MTSPWRLVALALPLALAAPASPAAAAKPAPQLRRLTDRDLLRYAAAPFDHRAMMFRHVILGRHNGAVVVADHPCGDVCPQYTRRIVHYDLAPERCARAGGVVVEELVPAGIAVRRRPYCEPKVLAKPAPPSSTR
ncbi:MAG: hypothetical protein QOJ27_1769 [Sphingomonadales bacterium]|nr:hypothetical protein [Sphingomonadales bacterium]